MRGIDLTRRKFGRLVVIGRSDKRAKNGSVLWECKCDCGNTTLNFYGLANEKERNKELRLPSKGASLGGKPHRLDWQDIRKVDRDCAQ